MILRKGLLGWWQVGYPLGEEGMKTRAMFLEEADAKRFAATPELLSACKTIIYAYENADAAPDALDKAYAAVAKAERA